MRRPVWGGLVAAPARKVLCRMHVSMSLSDRRVVRVKEACNLLSSTKATRSQDRGRKAKDRRIKYPSEAWLPKG